MYNLNWHLLTYTQTHVCITDMLTYSYNKTLFFASKRTCIYVFAYKYLISCLNVLFLRLVFGKSFIFFILFFHRIHGTLRMAFVFVVLLLFLFKKYLKLLFFFFAIFRMKNTCFWWLCLWIIVTFLKNLKRF